MGYPSFPEHSGLYIEGGVVSPHNHPFVFPKVSWRHELLKVFKTHSWWRKLSSSCSWLRNSSQLIFKKNKTTQNKKTPRKQPTDDSAEEENRGDAAGCNFVFVFFSSCLFKYAYHAILFIHLSICLRNDRVSDRPVNLSVFLHAHTLRSVQYPESHLCSIERQY